MRITASVFSLPLDKRVATSLHVARFGAAGGRKVFQCFPRRVATIGDGGRVEVEPGDGRDVFVRQLGQARVGTVPISANTTASL